MSTTALSPPPRMASPQRGPATLPVPQSIPRRSSRSRLHLSPSPNEPPIPPRLVGSPLLKKMIARADEPQFLSYKAQSELWIDGDEFGTRRRDPASPLASPASSASSASIPTPSSPRRTHRRTPSITSMRARSRSPPPTPALTSPPPPVPPIPSFALAAPGAKRAVVHPTIQIHIPDMDAHFVRAPRRNSRYPPNSAAPDGPRPRQTVP